MGRFLVNVSIVWFSEISARCKREVLLWGDRRGKEGGSVCLRAEGAQGKLQQYVGRATGGRRDICGVWWYLNLSTEGTEGLGQNGECLGEEVVCIGLSWE